MEDKELDTRAEELNNNSSDTEIDDILTYYEDSQSKDETFTKNANANINKPAAKKIEKVPETRNTVFEMPKKMENTFAAKDADRNRLYFICGAIILSLALIAFFVGLFIIPPSNTAIDKKTDAIRKTNKEYNLAKSDNAALGAGISSLEKSDENIEKVFDSVIEYQKKYDSLKAEKDEKTAELEKLNRDYEQLKSGYDKLQNKMLELKNRTLTLTPGIYTVGKNLPAGDYKVTGNGSMLVADNNNSLKINTVLDDTEFECALNDGDIIKLETQARLVPKGR